MAYRIDLVQLGMRKKYIWNGICDSCSTTTDSLSSSRKEIDKLLKELGWSLMWTSPEYKTRLVYYCGKCMQRKGEREGR